MESLGASPGALPSGVWFSSWYVVSIDTGHILKVHSPAQDGALLSNGVYSVCFLLQFHTRGNSSQDGRGMPDLYTERHD